MDNGEPGSARENYSAEHVSDPTDHPDFYKQMLDVSVDCIKLLNLDGTVRYINRSGCIALGVPVGETVFGMDWLSLMPASVRHNGKRALTRAQRPESTVLGPAHVTRTKDDVYGKHPHPRP